MGIKYALYPSKLSSCDGKYVAAVRVKGTKVMDDIIKDMLSRGSSITKAEALSVLEAFEASIERALSDGYRVNTPLFNVYPSIKGVFDSRDEKFNPKEHTLRLNVNPGCRIDSIKQKLEMEKGPAAVSLPIIHRFIDLASGTQNALITPGDVGEIKGRLLKINHDDYLNLWSDRVFLTSPWVLFSSQPAVVL